MLPRHTFLRIGARATWCVDLTNEPTRSHQKPSLEDRAWIKALASKMLTCGNPTTDDWSDRC